MRCLRTLSLTFLILFTAGCAVADARPGDIPEQGFQADMLDEFHLRDLNLPADMAGAFITSVDSSSPAGRAGLRPQVFIVSVNGAPIADVTALTTRFQQFWRQDAEALTLTVFDPQRQTTRTVTIQLPSPHKLAEQSSKQCNLLPFDLAVLSMNGCRDGNIESCRAALRSSMPSACTAIAQKWFDQLLAAQGGPANISASPPTKNAPTVAENSVGDDGNSPPFVQLNFLCTVNNGVASADRSGSYWHQVLRGDSGHPLGNESERLDYATQGTDLLQGMTFPKYFNANIFVYEIACSGGTANAAQIAVLTGAAIDGPPQPQVKGEPVVYFRDGALTAGKNSLPRGESLGPALSMQRFPHWDRANTQFTFPVAGTLPATPPAAPVPLVLTRVLSITAPWLQAFVAVLFGFPFLTILASYKPLPSKSFAGVILLSIAFVTLVVCLAGTAAPSDPATLRAPIDAQMTVAQAAASEIETLRAKLAALTTVVDGHVQPIKSQELQFVQSNSSLHVIPAIVVPPNPDFWLWLTLVPIAVILAFSYRAFVGAMYFLTSHAPSDIIEPMLKSGAAIYPNTAIIDALGTPIEDIITPPPQRHTQSMIARGKDLLHRIKQDREISEAAAERDMARVQMLDARARIRQARSKLPWWRRWFT